MRSPKTITLKTLLQHVQNGFLEMNQRFAAIDTRFNRLETKVDRHYALLSGQIDAIDKRLDVVEVAGIR